MKRTGICPKCEGRRVMHVSQVADAADWVGSGGDATLSSRSVSVAVPRCVLLQRKVSRGLLGGPSETFTPAGQTEAYVCVDCGFFEEYLQRPAAIPWDQIVGAHWRAAPEGEGGPYR